MAATVATSADEWTIETGEHGSISDAWREDGFVVARGLIRDGLVDALISEFRSEIVPSQQPLMRQPRFAREAGPRAFPHAYMALHELTPSGFVKQGLKDPHALARHPSVSGLCLRILCGSEMQQLLAACDERYGTYSMYQSMLFDANPGTEPHQDSYYIDSEPRGALAGIWIALEDIDERAGRFFLVKGSHRSMEVVGAAGMKNADYLREVSSRIGAHQADIVTPSLRKGDAILWRGDLVHGAHDVADERYSRKSITAHYVPAQLLARGNARVFANCIMRSAAGMAYAETTKPDPDARRVVGVSTSKVEIAGAPVSFLALETADGEKSIVVADDLGELMKSKASS